MYTSNLFSKTFSIDNNYIYINFLPDFRQTVTLYEEGNDYYANDDSSIIKIKQSPFTWINLSESGKWLLEVKHYENFKTYTLYILPSIKHIKTPLGEEFNQKINHFLNQTLLDYKKSQKNELRLYFYNSQKTFLSIVFDSYWPSIDLKYSLSRPSEYTTIDRAFKKPDQNCFILGKVKKTIGAKNGHLHDFIEPVSIILYDFKRDKYDFFDDFKRKISDLEIILIELLSYTIRKKYNFDSLETKRIQAYIEKKNGFSVTVEKAIKLFISEISDAFKNGDTPKLRHLYIALNTMLDCSEEQFSIVSIHSNDCIFIKYANGESQFVNSNWIDSNRNRCITS